MQWLGKAGIGKKRILHVLTPSGLNVSCIVSIKIMEKD
jgi:hypothetical protein